jgi:hypothetical protein
MRNAGTPAAIVNQPALCLFARVGEKQWNKKRDRVLIDNFTLQSAIKMSQKQASSSGMSGSGKGGKKIGRPVAKKAKTKAPEILDVSSGAASASASESEPEMVGSFTAEEKLQAIWSSQRDEVPDVTREEQEKLKKALRRLEDNFPDMMPNAREHLINYLNHYDPESEPE